MPRLETTPSGHYVESAESLMGKALEELTVKEACEVAEATLTQAVRVLREEGRAIEKILAKLPLGDARKVAEWARVSAPRDRAAKSLFALASLQLRLRRLAAVTEQPVADLRLAAAREREQARGKKSPRPHQDTDPGGEIP
jgi:hypothetical protein